MVNTYCPCGGQFNLTTQHRPGGRIVVKLNCQHCGKTHRAPSPRLYHQGRQEAVYLENLHRRRERYRVSG